MAQPILMPALSPTMEEGTIANWIKKEGDTIQSGDIIAEIETDKATMEVEAVDEGVLAKIIFPAGSENVKVNTLIAIIAEEGDNDSDVEAVMQSTQAKSSGVATEKTEETPLISASPNMEKEPPLEERIFASPLARRIALNEGLDLSNVSGSGPRGRIVKRDIEAALSAPQKVSSSTTEMKMDKKPQADLGLPNDLPFEDIPNSGMRKTIASRLLQSKQEVPHYYVSIDCEIDNLLELRKTLNAQSPEGEGAFKISVNDMIIKAVALALKKVPEMNVAWGGDFIRRFGQADIAVAVATEGGLITPIIRQADTKGLSTISTEMKDLATRARNGKLTPYDYQGGTFTISNLGMFGTKQFQAIVNPPSAGILAIGAGEKRPVVRSDALAIATVMTVTLSADHRSADGAVGALFIKAFKKYIENPLAMML